MARMTMKEAETWAERITDEMVMLGLIHRDDSMTVEVGSKTYGRAFRLYRKPFNEGGLSDWPLHLGDGFLGLTSDEARTTLRGILYTLEAISAMNKR